MPQLVTTFADFLALNQDAVHGPDRAVVNAFVEQAGVDLGGSLIGKAWGAQQIQHVLALDGGQRAWRLWSRLT